MRLDMTLLRHGQAHKALSDHRLHPLSAEGRRQAMACREKLGQPTYDLVLHSKLRRTKETARLVGGLDENGEMFTIPELFYEKGDPRGQVLDEVFKRLGHATLREYCEVAGDEMQTLAEDARIALVKMIGSSKAGNVLVIGHGILLQSICIALTRQDEPFVSRVLGECQGYRIIFEDGQITTLVEVA